MQARCGRAAHACSTPPAAAAAAAPRAPRPHLGGCLAHLDKVLLHLGDHLVQDLLGILGGAHCGRRRAGGGRGRWPVGRGRGRLEQSVTASRPSGRALPAPHSRALTQLVGVGFSHPHDAREQVGLDHHGPAGSTPGRPPTRRDHCGAGDRSGPRPRVQCNPIAVDHSPTGRASANWPLLVLEEAFSLLERMCAARAILRDVKDAADGLCVAVWRFRVTRGTRLPSSSASRAGGCPGRGPQKHTSIAACPGPLACARLRLAWSDVQQPHGAGSLTP